jgi:NADH dehydrogenase FAD-containing subunit
MLLMCSGVPALCLPFTSVTEVSLEGHMNDEHRKAQKRYSWYHAVRSSNPFITYFEAEATTIDIRKQLAICQSVKVVASNNPLKTFCVPYNYLVVAVGEVPATFGTPGVRENCFFMKEVSDGVALRKRISTQVRTTVLTIEDAYVEALLGSVVVLLFHLFPCARFWQF